MKTVNIKSLCPAAKNDPKKNVALEYGKDKNKVVLAITTTESGSRLIVVSRTDIVMNKRCYGADLIRQLLGIPFERLMQIILANHPEDQETTGSKVAP